MSGACADNMLGPGSLSVFFPPIFEVHSNGWRSGRAKRGACCPGWG